MKTINNELIRSFSPCYDPSEKNIPDDETLTVIDAVAKYRSTVPAKDIIWVLCRNEFLTDKDLRLFAVWCAREALKLDANPDERSVNACNVAERFANGEATSEELAAARTAARAAARDAARATAWAAAWDAWAASRAAALDARDAAYAAAWAAGAAARAASRAAYAARDARDARAAQIDKLLTYFV